MTFEAVLTRCIEALERNESVEACLSTWPDYADRLEPLLRIAGLLHSSRYITNSPLHLEKRQKFEAIVTASVEAFTKGQSLESTLACYPDYAEWLEPLLRIAERARAIQKPLPSAAPETGSDEAETKELPILLPSALILEKEPQASPFPSRQLKSAPALRQTRRFYWPSVALVSVAASVLLVISIVFNSAAQSLPGDPLYPVKRGGEQFQGAMSYLAGDSVSWHVAQVQRRLQELATMEATGRTPDPALVARVNAEVKVDADKALAQAAALPDEQSAPILANWLQWINNMQANTDQSSPVAIVLAKPLATVQSALISQPAVVELAPVAAPRRLETVVKGDGSLPLQASDVVSGTPMVISQPFGGNLRSTFVPPTATPQPNQASATPTPTSMALATTLSTPIPSDVTVIATVIAIQIGIPTNTPAGSTLQPATSTPLSIATVTATRTPTLNEIATASTTSAPSLLPTSTDTPVLIPTVTSTAPTLAQNTPTESMAPSDTPLPTSTSLSLLVPTSTPAPTNTPLPSATLPSQPFATQEPSATLTEPTDTPQLTATDTTQPMDTPLPADTFTPQPTDTPQPMATDTPEPTDTLQPTATDTPEPTDTPQPATDTPEPTDTLQPTATDTPEPTATDTLVPTDTLQPTDTPLPTATFTSEPTDAFTLLPTETLTPEPTDSGDPTFTPDPTDAP